MSSVPPDQPILTHLGQDRCADLGHALSTEWLETDGLGGFASSTILFGATRRYHGLLVALPPGRHKRHLFLSRYQETLLLGKRAHPLAPARYGETWETTQPPEHFELTPYPSVVLRFGEVEILREVMLVRGKPLVLCRYRVRGDTEDAELELRPFLPTREADALTVENEHLNPEVEVLEDGIRCQPYEALPALSITLGKSAHRFAMEPLWYRNITFSADEARGYTGSEEQFTPGKFRIPLKDGAEVVIAATIGAPPKNPAALWKKESRRRRAAAAAALEEHDTSRARAVLAADDFLYRTPAPHKPNGGRVGVDAGYPWFGEWGRDTFISLPGLTLSRGRVDACAEVLSGALEYLQEGLLPNVYGTDQADSHYNSADASLWFARAVRLYERQGGDKERVLEEYLPALREIAECYGKGTGLGIRADDEQLIAVGDPTLNPTWMDARTPDGSVTPRNGYPVEINALWFALLRHLELCYEELGQRKTKREWTAKKRSAKRAFMERFWIEEHGRLADVWKDGRADRHVRPNMVIAAALEHSPLNQKQRRAVVASAQALLLTPKGLRTLAPADAEYCGRYEGAPEQRDAAYHQGTVWPWLLGFYCEAKLRADGGKRQVRDELADVWRQLESELDQSGLEHFSEVFDGDPPQRASGTIAQAWNTAEYLRSMDMIARGRP